MTYDPNSPTVTDRIDFADTRDVGDDLEPHQGADLGFMQQVVRIMNKYTAARLAPAIEAANLTPEQRAAFDAAWNGIRHRSEPSQP